MEILRKKINFIQKTYEIHANGTDVALCVCVILEFVIKNFVLELPNATKGKQKMLTANLRSKQDLPTPESPINNNLNR